MKTAILCSPRCLFTVSASLLLAGCSVLGSREQKPESVPASRNPLEIKTAPALLEQVKIGPPVWAQVAGSLRVPGRVEVDETRMARVGSPVTGRITELEVLEGQTVKRGQILATLHSSELSDAQFDFLKAYSQQQLARRATLRARQLLEAGVIGEAELQRREAEFSQASAEVSSARDELKVLGMSEEAIARLEATRTVNSLSHIVASIDGTVLERKITIGQVVQPADTLFVLADLSHVWLVAEVPEQTSGHLAAGKAVEAEIAAFPGEQIQGVLSLVSATVNPETRTVRIRMNLPNPAGKYKPAMLATMVLKDRPENRLMIPASAVVREGAGEHVFVQTGPDTFVLRQVTLGGEFGDGRAVISGLRPGEKIVLDGAFHLNNERKRIAAQGL
jgi:cobalt-zinc-cadmium efflux system membrane fusion protein